MAISNNNKRAFVAYGTLTKGQLVSLYSTTEQTVQECGANDNPIGVVDDYQVSTGERVCVIMLQDGIEVELIASENVTVNEVMYTAANGKIQDKTTATLKKVGYALQSGSTNEKVPVLIDRTSPASVAT